MAASLPAATKSTTENNHQHYNHDDNYDGYSCCCGGGDASCSSAVSAYGHAKPKTQRGLNKPKCIQCGNVARSRCPYRSCKSCCSKAQNPCHIHVAVLKSNSAFPEKSPTSSTPSSEQKLTQASSQVNPLRVPSFRQLSNAFAQFDNLQVRSKKHLTKKDAVALNE